MKKPSNRKTKQMNLIIEQLKKTPIIQIACEKMGVSRATYYRWYKANKKFAHEADEAIQSGKLLINDMAESQLLTAIKNQNLTAIIYWLNHNHNSYKNKLEVSGTVKTLKKLSKEEAKLVEKALLHAGLGKNELLNNNNNEIK